MNEQALNKEISNIISFLQNIQSHYSHKPPSFKLNNIKESDLLKAIEEAFGKNYLEEVLNHLKCSDKILRDETNISLDGLLIGLIAIWRLEKDLSFVKTQLEKLKGHLSKEASDELNSNNWINSVFVYCKNNTIK